MSGFFDGYGTLYGTVLQILPREAFELIKKGAILVDVRNEAEMNGKYFQIPGLIYIERRHLEDRYERLPIEKPLILADSVGLNGKEAVLFLQRKGYSQLANLNGGIFAWEDEKLPWWSRKKRFLPVHAPVVFGLAKRTDPKAVRFAHHRSLGVLYDRY